LVIRLHTVKPLRLIKPTGDS